MHPCLFQSLIGVNLGKDSLGRQRQFFVAVNAYFSVLAQAPGNVNQAVQMGLKPQGKQIPVFPQKETHVVHSRDFEAHKPQNGLEGHLDALLTPSDSQVPHAIVLGHPGLLEGVFSGHEIALRHFFICHISITSPQR